MQNEDSNGEISVNATGGTGPYEYSIDGAVTWQASNVFSGLLSNSYTIEVRDANLCLKSFKNDMPMTVQYAAATAFAFIFSCTVHVHGSDIN